MKRVHYEAGSRPIKIWTDDIEDEALAQAKNVAALPFIHRNGVALMPDVHAGIGATVGSVFATEGAVIPSAVGVDIGCGMDAVLTGLYADDFTPALLRDLRHQIERDVPIGTGGEHKRNDDLLRNAHRIAPIPAAGMNMPVRAGRWQKVVAQLGTLGSGNHFIEVCLDTTSAVWVMLHSGSRGIGNEIGRHFINLAKAKMKQWHITLSDPDLAYLPEGTEEFDQYIRAVEWAQAYAAENRKLMMELTLAAMRRILKNDFLTASDPISCHHNYLARENHFSANVWVTRKGAIRARKDELGIIPGSMGQRSFIVRGLGNPEAYHSSSHGAGRVMSRTKALKTFTLEDLKTQTEGVECRKDKSVLDEIPGAYKDIDVVMENQRDLVEVVHTLKQIMCVKGG